MKHIKKSVLLWYSPAEMYRLVTDIREYPKFLPWCQKAEVIEETETSMTGRLHLSYAGVRHAFTTRNTHVPDSSVTVELVDGPFSVLNGIWRFVPLQAPEPDQKACKIEFEMKYAFSNLPFEMLLSPVFDRVANTFVDSFVKRAEQVYGPR
ncbi:MAG: type II toxin-antitoxin system RatA family toxin [Rhizobacter sp.]|jgi:ribosome-associated toxin RatA of RatAB toxin-antitoxin module